MVVLSPGHYQAFFAVILGFLVYWVLKGTLWYMDLTKEDNPCRDLNEVKLWIIGLYLTVVYYVTVEMIGLIAICSQREDERDSEELLVQSSEDEQEIDPFFRQNDDLMCAICLLPLLPTHSIRQLSCSHIYHAACISPWLSTSATCPTCHSPVN